MSRIPPTPPDGLNDKQLNLHNELVAIGEAHFGESFIWRRADGALLGPFPAYLYEPDVAHDLLKLLMRIREIPDLPPRPREVAILVSGTLAGAVYQVYSHEPPALEYGLTRRQIDEIKAGKKPEDLNEQEAIAYDVTTELMARTGPLPQETWNRAEKAFGKKGTFALLQMIGFYSYINVILNGLDVPVPEGAAS